MKKAMGLVELLIVVIVIVVVYFTCFHSTSGRKNPFEEQINVKSKQELVDKKLENIQSQKAIKDRIEQNLNRENY